MTRQRRICCAIRIIRTNHVNNFYFRGFKRNKKTNNFDELVPITLKIQNYETTIKREDNVNLIRDVILQITAGNSRREE